MLAAALLALTIPPPVIAGYLPAWKTADYNFDRLAPLTDVLYFSVQPNEDGTLNLKDIRLEDLPKLRAAKKRFGFRLLLCVGGWERGAHFMTVSTTEAKRNRFVVEADAFCDRYGFDGIDLDWEHPKTEEEGKAYGTLIQALHKAFLPQKRIVTAAIAAWQTMSAEAVSGLDRVHLMSYDHPKKHSTLELAKSDVEKLEAMGFPRAKIALGVPFYGRSLSDWSKDMAYAEIATTYMPKAEEDEAGGFYFNGPAMLKAKAEYVRSAGLAGVMIWEVTQDSADNLLVGTLAKGLAPRASR